MNKTDENNNLTGLEIAVIGMAGRFPGAKNIEEFWKNLENGIESVTFFSNEELGKEGIDPGALENPLYVKTGGSMLENNDCFDAFFFGYSSTEAEIMDPQMRIFHECIWEAFENAGYDPYYCKRLIGCYAGGASNFMWEASIRFMASTEQEGITSFEAEQFYNKDYLCTRLAHRLNLRGPAVAVQTACSTSLVAIHLACQGLLCSECDIAAAGGVSIVYLKKSGYEYVEGMIASPDGHCRAFDEKAKGCFGGDGVGVVVLKRLNEALRDRDQIYAVVKGSHINNDGVEKAGYTAPGVEGQAAAIRTALQIAEVEVETIGYVETHGTGTTLGDPVEFEGLKLAFNTGKKQFCALGAIKTNIGHLNSAAGVAGFIKTVLALKYKRIPPTLHYMTPNPKIDFKNSPFFINTQLREWVNQGYPLRAGVSSFGIGGTNAHVILEEAPPAKDHEVSPSRNFQLLLFSAKTASALQEVTKGFVEYIKKYPGIDMADAAYTLQVGRRAFAHREMLVHSSLAGAVQVLETSASDKVHTYTLKKNEDRVVVFMFPGQGSQYENMGLELYQKEPVFQKEMNRCFDIAKPLLGYDLREILYPGEFTASSGNPGIRVQRGQGEEFDNEISVIPDGPAAKIGARDIDQTEVAQPILFIFSYALANLLMRWGIKPYAMIGHSIGEYIAACLAGVFSLEDALKLVVLRGKLMQRIPGGAMLGLQLPEEEVTPFLNDDLWLAAVNSTALSVVSGTYEAIAALQAKLQEKGYNTRYLHTSHAFHSNMMDPILDEFKEHVKTIRLNKPAIPYVSNVTGQLITEQQVVDPGYWVQQLRRTVQFSRGIEVLLEEGYSTFVEVGAGNVLTTFVRQHMARKPSHLLVSLVKPPRETASDLEFLLNGIGHLWLYGNNLDWSEFYAKEKRNRVQLPTYPFERESYRRQFEMMGYLGYMINGLKGFSNKADSLSIPIPPIPGKYTTPVTRQETGKKEDLQLFQRTRELTTQYAPPRNEVEFKLVQIWQRFFGQQEVGIYDSFYDLGGDSLKAISLAPIVRGTVNVDIPLSEFFQRYTIEKLAEYICNERGHLDESPGGKIEIYITGDFENLNKPFPVMPLQAAYLLGRDSQFELGGVATHVYQEFEQRIDIGVLNKAINKIIKRHPMFRAVVFLDGQQQILDVPEYKIVVDDLGQMDAEARKNHIFMERKIMSHHIYKTDQWPLFTLKALKLSKDNNYLLLFSIDHLIMDAGSLVIFFSEMMKFCQNPDLELPELEFTYRDYAIAYEKIKSEDKYKAIKQYWLDQLKDFPISPNLPLKCDPSKIASPLFKRKQTIFRKKEWKKLKEIARKNNVTPSVLICTAYAEVLSYWSNQTALAINVTLFNRYPFHPDVDKIIGDFSSIILLGVELRPGNTFWENVRIVQRNMMEALENRLYDGLEFQRELRRYRNVRTQAIMPVVFTSTIFGSDNEAVDTEEIEEKTDSSALEGDQVQDTMTITQTSQVYLDCMISETEGVGTFVWDYVEALFASDVINPMFNQFVMIINSLLQGKNEYNLQPPEAHRLLLEELNSSSACYPYKTIQELFADQSKKAPDSTALIAFDISSAKGYTANTGFDNHHLSYEKLDEKANQAAHLLRKKGINRNHIVGIYIERSLEMVVGILGILKADGGYLPIEPIYPGNRVHFMVKDSSVGILLTTRDLAGNIGIEREEIESVYLDEIDTFPANDGSDIENNARPYDPAYVIYTSGTTGRPKGTVIENKNVVSLMANDGHLFDFDSRDTWTLFHSFCFDFSVWEMYGALLYGGKLILIPRSISQDAADYLNTLKTGCVTVLNQTPSAFYILSEQELNCPDKTLNLRYVIFGGEALAPKKLEGWKKKYPGTKLVNMYGITETTVHVTYKEITGIEIEQSISNIGKTIPTLHFYVLSHNLSLLPVGVAGELCVSGEGVGRGYLNRPELTASKFMANPYELTERMYRSGDLVRLSANGELEYLGRIDRQAKVRGFRIEPGEIERQLLNYKGIKAAVVLLKAGEGEDKSLWAYIVADQELDLTLLKQYLAKSLPEYMIPSFFVPLDKVPLTPNGKVDINALPTILPETGDRYVAPRSPIEEGLVDLWAQVLGVEKNIIGIDTNFFDLGGHSLKVTVLLARIHKELNVKISLRDFFTTPTIRDLSGYLDKGLMDRFIAIEPVEVKEYYVLSSAQKRLFVLHQLEEEGLKYNLPYFMTFEGYVDKVKLEESCRQLIKRHESLRTSFLLVDETPVQRINQNFEFEIEILASAGMENGNPKDTSSLIQNFVRPFNLESPPLLRVGLIETVEKGYILGFDIHHIISDGVSLQILINDFFALYSGKELSPLKLHYKDYSEWEQSQEVRRSIKQQEEYWLAEFAGEIPVLDLPTDYPRPPVQSFEGRVITFETDGGEVEKLNEMANSHGVTLFIFMQAIFKVFLSKICNQEEILLGTTNAGRRYADLEKITGMFVNTLVLRNEVSPYKTFREFLLEVRDKTLNAFENQDYQFEELVEKLMVKRDMSRNPLFDVLFEFQNYMDTTGKNSTPGAAAEGLKINSYPYEQGTSQFDLTMNAIESREALHFSMGYCTKLFKQETIQRFIYYIKRIVASVIEAPGKKIGEIEILSQEERGKLLYEFNNNQTFYPRDKIFRHFFEEQVERTPDHIAISGPSLEGIHRSTLQEFFIQVSYTELQVKSDGLAQQLRMKNIEPEAAVGIKMERSIEMIIGIIGIFKAGGVYLPIDIEYPQDRIDFILRDSGSKMLLTESEIRLSSSLPINSNVIQSTHPTQSAQPHHLAYVIYTSGSTGKPKGALVEHIGMMNHLHIKIDDLRLNIESIVAQTASHTFDISIWQFLAALVVGGKTVIYSHSLLLEPSQFMSRIIRDQVTIIEVVPSYLSILLELIEKMEMVFLPIKYLLATGEELKPHLVNKWFRLFPGIKMVNAYGPTEASDDITHYFMETAPGIERIPIGKPLQNFNIYIVDEHINLCPLGVKGEICVSGLGVGRGYLNDQTRTKQVFREDPFLKQKGVRFYKTGDFGRWFPDGTIEFLGRKDYQVKINGFRIECGEIENRLLEFPPIKEAVVLASEVGSEDYLCAYIVSQQEFTLTELRQYLSGKLPDYMIPAYFRQVEKIPITPNGKVDRKALMLYNTQLDSGITFVPPRDGIEKKLAEIWSEVLGIEYNLIGIDNEFFQLGGNSLKATILVSKIHKVLNIKIPLTEIFKTPTVRALTGLIKKSAKEKYAAIDPVEEKEYYPLSPGQKRLYVLQQMIIDNISYNLPYVIPLTHFIAAEKLELILKRLIHRHESLRTSFRLEKDEPIQIIHKKVDFSIHCTHASEGEAMNITSDFAAPFDLSKAPLLRAELLTVESNRQILLIDMHHIIADGISQYILEREFMALFLGEELPPLRLQYKDYSEWQNRNQQRLLIKEQERYWTEIFADEVPVLNLPTDYPRPVEQSFDGSTVTFLSPAKECLIFKELVQQTGATVYMCILSLFTILLSRLSGQEDIVVGTPIAARRHVDLEKIIGMFVNTLALRNFPCGEKSYREFLLELKERSLKAYENQEYPFEELVDKLSVSRDTSRNPVFDVMFNFVSTEEYSGGPIADEQWDQSQYIHQKGTSKFDLTLAAVDLGKGFLFSFEYCSQLFKPETINRFIANFKRLLYSLSVNPDASLFELELISQEEKHQILYVFNDTKVEFPGDKNFCQLFEEQVEKFPDHIAIISTSGASVVEPALQLTYREINEKSNQIASFLLRELSMQPDMQVGILMERSNQMAESIIAVWKSGGAYIPLDTQYPMERIDSILQDSRAAALITDNAGITGDLRQSLKSNALILCRQESAKKLQEETHSNLDIMIGKSDLAYVIYTSGSTGKPKGVMVEHAGMTNHMFSKIRDLHLNAESVIAQNASHCFDISVWQFFAALVVGGRTVIYHRDLVVNTKELISHIHNDSLTVLEIVPSHLSALLDILNTENLSSLYLFRSLQYLVTTGEAIKPALVNRWLERFPHIKVVNAYGPTEASDDITHYFMSERQDVDTIPLGTPLPNLKIYITDNQLNLCPVGVKGEILVSGVGIGRGYLNDVVKTHDSFINDPFRAEPGIRLYKTGDIGRYLEDGRIEFFGRKDYQLKIRGFRIELGEIESQLMEYPGIKEAVVLAGDQEDKYLCAYFTSDREILLSLLKEYMVKFLPGYMIPAHFIPLDKMPLTPNGKIDRKALPKPELNVGKIYSGPRNEIEKKLIELWAEVLSGDAADTSQLQHSIGIDDNFFDLGGHSLRVTILISRIHRELNVIVPLLEVFKTPRIRELSEYIKGKRKESFKAMEAAEEKEYYALSPAQKRLYVLQDMAIDNTAYNMFYAIPLGQGITKEKIELTFKKLIARHESLRTSFEILNEKPIQRIHKDIDFPVRWANVSEVEAENIISHFIEPFDLSQAPILRVELLTIASIRQTLLIDMHHIITDGLSQNILEKEFIALYSGEEFPPLRLRYKDYVEWQNNEKQRLLINEEERYWLELFGDEVPVLNLPTDYPRPIMQSFEGSLVGFLLTTEESQIFKELVKQTGATLYMCILSVFTILLSRLSGLEDIIVGTPIAARRHVDLENIIGMFVNTLAMRNVPRREMRYGEFLLELKERTLKAYENQEYPFEELVDKISVSRDTSRNPLFDVMFNLLNQGEYSEDLVESAEKEQYIHQEGTSKFDMILSAFDLGERYLFYVEYCTRLYKPETIDRYISYFRKLLDSLSEDFNKKLSALEIIPQDEKHQILYEFNATGAKYPKNKTIHQMFEQQADKTRDSIALTGTSAAALHELPLQITYRELNKQSNRLARKLRSEGIGGDSIVGLMVERSIEMITGLLGIIKAGGAYLPIDSQFPNVRKKYMLEDSRVKLLLVNLDIENGSEYIPEYTKVIDLREENIYPGKGGNLAHINRDFDLLYVIYTSGSTGQPKGVMLQHRNLVNLLKFQSNHTNIDCSRILQFATISFDVSFQEIFSSFLSGGQLFLVDNETRTDIPELFKLIERNGIKTLFLPISFLKLIFKEEAYIKRIPRCIAHILTAGEQVVISNNFKKYLKEQGIYLHNHYGPSEAHVVTTLTIDPAGIIPELPSIGKPVMNSWIYIVDKGNHLLPIGISGELCIGGRQVGRGYLGNAELTREKFSPNPFKTDDIVYRSGDLARWLPDGNIEFLGRIDYQVKIRGFRVETGEIESRLSNYPGIKEAVVVVREDKSGDKYLCAYIVSHKEYAISELRESLSKGLPDYMIPSQFIPIEKIPLTPSGKLNRKALPEPEAKVGEGYLGPRNEIEEKLVDLWSEILGVERDFINIDKGFFELGGHSLKAMILAAKLHRVFDVKVPLTEIFKTPRIKDLAEYIKGKRKEFYRSIESTEEKEYYAISPAQERLYVLQQMTIDNTGYNMPSAILLPQGITKEKLELVFKKLIVRHESLRTSFAMVNENPIQKIHKEIDFSIRCTSVSEVEAEHIIFNFTEAFDLSKAPLLRVELLDVASTRQILLIDMHHIITDGISINILEKEFRAFYSGEELPPLRLQYKDYSEWQNSEQQRLVIREQETHWLETFADEILVLNLPTDYPRPLVQSFDGASVDFLSLDKENQTLRRLAKETDTTLYMCILSVFTILLSRLGGQEDIIVGMPIAARRHIDLEKIIGMFVNTLAMRNVPCGEKRYREFLLEIKERTLKAYENQEYPFEQLVEKISVNRDPGRNPLFDVMFSFLNRDEYNDEIPGPAEEEKLLNNHRPGNAKFDLTLTAVDLGEGFLFNIEYCTRLYKPETINQYISYFKKILDSLADDFDKKLSELELIGESEKHCILYEFNDNETKYPKNKTIHQLFGELIEMVPDKVAVIGPSAAAIHEVPLQITYRELDEKSNRLAYSLQEKGIRSDSIVGIMADRSMEMIIGILGILKSGGAYMPIEPNYPQERIEYMLKDSMAKMLLTHDLLFESPASAKHFDSQRSLNASHLHPQPHPLAYIIYTSGTTGRPKGTMIEHRSLVNLCFWHNIYYSVTERDHAAQYAGYGFDASVWEIFPYLIRGAALHIIDDDIKFDIQLVGGYYKKYHISIGFLPTQFCQQFIEEWSDIRSLRVLLTGGDKLGSAKETAYRLYNNYGPTENTVVTTSYLVETYQGSIPIGKPISNTKVYIIDKYNNLQAVGVPGELSIGGESLSRGYLNQPELTAEKFKRAVISHSSLVIGSASKISDYSSKLFTNDQCPMTNDRFYRTGDLVRWLSDGNIEFLGRIDHQLKIRGFRIESGEIENQLLKHEAIKQVVVLLKDNRLYAYITADKEINSSQLRNHLATKLPDYMIPSHFVQVEKIPLTPNGKVDTKSLDILGKKLAIGTVYAPPQNEIEREISATWKQVLNLDTVGIHDNYFELGGTSLDVLRINAKLKERFKRDIPVVVMFTYSTVHSFADYIMNSQQEKSEEIRDRSAVFDRSKIDRREQFRRRKGTAE
jgi:tyrocidine synthetase-3